MTESLHYCAEISDQNLAKSNGFKSLDTLDVLDIGT